MVADEPTIRPATHALEALISRTIAQVRNTHSGASTDAMLFLGNWHHAFPALLVQDPVLEPVDKVVWMVICQQGRATGISTAFPSYRQIARQANIASTSTVSRAVAILRATRWLSLCARVRDAGGRFRGNVYALHDEPLPLADAIFLDSGYMAFIKEAETHHHARVRRVATAVLASIDEDIASGVDVLRPERMVERRLEATQAVREDSPRRFFSFSPSVLYRLASQKSLSGSSDQHQKSKSDAKCPQDPRPQKSKSVGCSSSYIKTTTHSKNAREICADSELDRLIYPKRLTPNQRELAARYLATVPAEQRQPVLDELDGRLRAEQRGAKPVYDELRYLHRLCVQVNDGGFQPNLGLKVQTEREQRARENEKRRQEAQQQQERRRQREDRQDKAVSEDRFAEMRQILGSPARGGCSRDDR